MNPTSAAAEPTTVVAARLRRSEIADALRGVRRRNRLAALGLAVSVFLAFGSLGFLWLWKAGESEDPIALKFRSPIEFRSPFEFERKKNVGNGIDQFGPANGGLKSGSPSDLNETR
jgi:hypothetical protein